MCIIARVFILIAVVTSRWKVKGNELEDVFGFGAEDNEENFIQSLVDLNGNFIGVGGEDNAKKATRQDQEDVEMFLKPGPMIAPDIILKGYVDSRVSLSNMLEDLEKTQPSKNPKPNINDEIDNNSIMDSDEESLHDDYFPIFAPFTSTNFSSDLNDLFPNRLSGKQQTEKPCLMNFQGEYGGFNMSFDKNCVIEISSPSEDSRLILTCSPISLGDCSTNKDSLSVNVMGDTSFKQNSFLYCGTDANIRAISFKNKLAIKIKQSDMIKESTFCTYHSRTYTREYATVAATDNASPSASFTSSPITCGKLGRTGKIVGGRRVPPGLFPWAVQLDITRTDGTQTGCTGTVISPQYVLTAAHCMKRAESVSAFMGGTDRFDIVGSEILIQAEKYILHKKWSSRTLVADIALVKLTQPIEYSEDISPICLPEGRLLSEDLSGKRGVAIGWGRTETKKKAPRRLYRIKLPLLSDSSCKNIYRRFYIPKVMMCTDSKKDAAICYGMARNFLKHNWL